jgi:SAM-dependent methyltransferase
MQKRLKFKKIIKYLIRKDLHTSLFERYLHLLSALQYPNIMKGERMLDLGCGNGEFPFLLNIKNKIALGVDESQKKLNLARKTGNYNNLLKADICKLYKLLNQQYEIIICNSVLEHIKNLESALKSIFNLLCKGGKFIFTVPRKGWEQHLLHSRIDKRYGEKINALFRHANLWGPNKWERILRRHKFKILICRKFISPYSYFLTDILFNENNINSIKKTLYELYKNDEKLCKIYGGWSLYFEVTK